MRAILPLRPALLPVRPLGCSIGLDPSIGPDRSSAVDRLIIRGHLDWPATWLFVILLLLLTAPLEAQAGGLPTDPLLRLETGMHTGPISRIGVDQAGGLLITASDDKTLRLWNPADGSLLRTLRPPVGPGDEGRLYAAALSPDGQWVATGGSTQAGGEGQGTYLVYLFDRASGELRHFLVGLPDVVNHLCFSRDGRHLAASFGSGGIRVWTTAGWQAVASDSQYGDASLWCDFGPDGQLVTSALDGQIRLYDADFNLIAKRPAPGGKEPFAVAFSPDGGRIAVGLADAPAVALLSGQDLQPLEAPGRKGLDNGDLSKVAWSADGQRLYAGGRFQREGKFPVVVWEKGGKGERRFWTGTGNSLADLRPLASGDLLVGTNDPAWLRFNPRGEVVQKRASQIPDLRDKLGEHFRLSATGRQVAVGLGYGGDQPVMFDLDAKRLFTGQINETWLLQQRLDELGFDPGGIDGTQGPQLRKAINEWRQEQGLGPGGLDDAARRGLGISPLKAPRVKADGLKLGGWENGENPKLGGKPLALAPHETSRALAIAPDAQSFLLGTSWYLRRYDRQGQLLWQTPVQDTAWGVNISADGRVAVAACGDGTLRWYRYSDGQELLALFVHRETREWVLWSPKGFYDASPGGDRLIGWHLNRAEMGEGLAVLNIVPGSAADTAGIRPGDQIESVNGLRPKTKDELIEIITQSPAGEPIRVNLLRGLDYLAFEVWPQRANPQAPPKVGTLVGKTLARADAADFYPVANFRDRFYRPQVMAKVLDTLDEGQAIAQANTQGGRALPEPDIAASLPPMVHVLSPRDGDSFGPGRTTLRYRLKNTGGEPLRQLQVLVNGRPLDTQRGLQRVSAGQASAGQASPGGQASPTVQADQADQGGQGQGGQGAPAADGEQVLEIDLPPQDLTLTLVAENRFGASPPETIRLRWEGGQGDEFVAQPKLYALLAGVSDYEDDSLDLQFAAKDAKDFGEALRRQAGGLYREVEIRSLENPTSEELLDGLDWLRSEVTSRDIAVIFISGHGVNDPDGDYYYLTRDANPERLRRTAVPYFEVKKTLSALPGKVLAFVDTCHSGNIMGGRRAVTDITGVINDLTSAENGVVVFASSTGKQYSLENPEWGNGAFTKALVEGIDGAADYTQDGRITVNKLDLYLSERVKKLTGNKQTPTTTKPQTIQDFPIALKKAS